MEEKKKFKLRGIIILVGVVLFISGYIYVAYLVGGASNIGKKIKCPTYPVDEEYEGTIKTEYKGLILVDGIYSHIDWDKVYDGCYRDAGLEDNNLVCPDGYNSGARIEEKGEWVLDIEENHCYYPDSDVSMLKAIYDERHRED